MDVTRYVVVTMGSAHLCEVLLTYLRKRKDKYNWILKRASQLNEENCFFFWWGKDMEFSITPLRSFLKRTGDKEVLLAKSYGKQTFTISRKKRSVVGMLPDEFSTSRESHMGEDLSAFLQGLSREPDQGTLTESSHRPTSTWASPDDAHVSTHDVSSNDDADSLHSENVEVVEEGDQARRDHTDERIELIMKAVVHLMRKVEQLPTDMIDLLGERVVNAYDNPQSADPHQQIPPTVGYLQMF